MIIIKRLKVNNNLKRDYSLSAMRCDLLPDSGLSSAKERGDISLLFLIDFFSLDLTGLIFLLCGLVFSGVNGGISNGVSIVIFK